MHAATIPASAWRRRSKPVLDDPSHSELAVTGLAQQSTRRVRRRAVASAIAAALGWVAATATGAAGGARVALLLFPDAALGASTRINWWHATGFALSIGIALAVAQSLALWLILKSVERAAGALLALWIPATSLGIVFMLLPLWQFNERAFPFIAFAMLVPALPGMMFLGFSQWLLLRRRISIRFRWVVLTVCGAAVGFSVGLVVAYFFGGLLTFEIFWALVTGLGIGLLQAIELGAEVKRLQAGDPERPKPKITPLPMG